VLSTSLLGVQVYDNFVPNYKDLATVHSIFNKATPARNRVLLEQNLVNSNSNLEGQRKNSVKEPIDNIVYKSFVKRFNEKYHTSLNESQKSLVTKFVTSFADGGLELKMFLNEEVGSLKKDLSDYVNNSDDDSLKNKVSEVISVLENMKTKDVDVGMVETVLKIQQLKEEIKQNVSKN
jgi:seryl-tRNA synthetase